MKTIGIYITGLLLLSFTAFTQDKETPPPGGQPKDFTLPERQTVKLDNGLELIMIPYGAVPKATINITVKTGNIHEGEAEVWLADLVGDLMEEGSTGMTSKEIADKMAGMGGNLNIGVGAHTTSLSSSVLYEFTPEAIKVMAGVLQNPKFPESEIDRLKNDMKRQLSVTLSRPQPKASQAFYAQLYPDHSYGRLYPSEDMISSFNVEMIRKHYNENFGARRTTVYVAGKFNASAVEKAVREAFGKWKEGPAPQYIPATPSQDGQITILDRPDAPQSTIMLGLPVPDPSSADYIALDVMNSLLGGSFGSRITSNIREDKGYTYSPASNISDRYKSAIWYEQADVTTEFTGPSLQEITKEIDRLQKEAPSQEELKGIQNYEAGVFVLQNSTPSGIIGQLVYLDVYDLDESFLTNKVQNIYAVTPEKIREMAQKYIRPEGMTLVIVGDKKVIEQQIKDYEKSIKDY
ncbi:insulinase family protein [Fulvivirga ulvae]|uniref:M16 family metallopeptidase n=1 Tax=Fulvivirga ulvae TaxID=2904245 RepID=UPI001F2E292B|nr:pitrilysin family protein [Fulvivirga ulvae]UII30493.1 insulinase family protein [Fulvivirga ulvae]